MINPSRYSVCQYCGRIIDEDKLPQICMECALKLSNGEDPTK